MESRLRRRRLGQTAVAGVCLTLILLGTAATATARRTISISTPCAYQIVQRNGADRATILVEGKRRGFKGSVQVRWGAGPWKTVACARNGSFRVRLRARRAGQATLTVRSARRHGIVARRVHVGVGDIYVIAGQSNASGRGPLRFAASHPLLRASLFGNDFRWRPLRDPTDSADGQVDAVSLDGHAGGSVWPLVATELMAVERVPVAFVPCARGTTTIARWQRPPFGVRSASSLYGSMMRRIAAVGGRVRAVLFWQGEADARAVTARSVYKAALQRLAADIRRDCGAPVVAAQIGDFDARYTAAGIDGIRLAQQDVWSSGQVTPGPVLYDVDLGDNVHFIERDDLLVAARRWSGAIVNGVLAGGATRAPRLRGAVYDGERTIELSVHAGLLPLVPGPVGGIVVREDGRDVQVLDAWVTGARTITLSLEEPAHGPLAVTLGSGRTAAGFPVPVESSRWQLPMLMFVDREVGDPQL